ncbi:hypothetical protein G7Y79_00027g061050 [Physcia stellaris]|nr:hypothetical protein G7Y79_00027g061050 [Physcia stellaris]
MSQTEDSLEAMCEQVKSLINQRDAAREDLERYKRDAELMSRTIEVSERELGLKTREANYLSGTLEKWRKDQMSQAYDHGQEVERWKDQAERESTRASRAEHKSAAQAYSLEEANKTIQYRDATIMKLNRKYGVESSSHFDGKHVVWDEESSLKHMITILNTRLEQYKEEAELRNAELERLRKETSDLKCNLETSETTGRRQEGLLTQFHNRDVEKELRDSKAREAQNEEKLRKINAQNLRLRVDLDVYKQLHLQVREENAVLRQQATDALESQLAKFRTENDGLQEVVDKVRDNDLEQLTDKCSAAESRAKATEEENKRAWKAIIDLAHKVLNGERGCREACRDLIQEREKTRLNERLGTSCHTEPVTRSTQNGGFSQEGHGLPMENNHAFDPSWNSAAGRLPENNHREWFGGDNGKGSVEGDKGKTPDGDLWVGQKRSGPSKKRTASTTPQESPEQPSSALWTHDAFFQ